MAQHHPLNDPMTARPLKVTLPSCARVLMPRMPNFLAYAGNPDASIPVHAITADDAVLLGLAMAHALTVHHRERWADAEGLSAAEAQAVPTGQVPDWLVERVATRLVWPASLAIDRPCRAAMVRDVARALLEEVAHHG